MSALRRPAHPRAGEPEEGSALIEFVGGTVVLLVPLVYVLLVVFALQRAAFAADEAAREAGRAFATASDTSSGLAAAQYAATLAFADQGLTRPPQLRYTAAGSGCGASARATDPSTAPGSTFTICVGEGVTVPGVPFLSHLAPAGFRVTGRFGVNIDAFRATQ